MVKRIGNEGFTLIEIMIALAIFAVFITVYTSGQGNNLLKSLQIREEVTLRNLAQMKLNELIVDPPDLKENLTSNVDTKTFEDYDDYEYSVTFKKFVIPSFEQITGEQDQETSSQNALQKKIFEQVKKNLEKVVWQVEVIVTNKLTSANYSLATWLYNQNAKVEFTQ